VVELLLIGHPHNLEGKPALEKEKEKEKQKARNNLRYNSLTAWLLVVSFAISFVSLIIYLAEAGFSDEILLILLLVLRYSAFMVCLCSLHKMVMHMYGVFRRYKFHPKKFAFFVCFLLYGVCIILFESFIVAISRGNG